VPEVDQAIAQMGQWPREHLGAGSQDSPGTDRVILRAPHRRPASPASGVTYPPAGESAAASAGGVNGS
jgi:hypothetical protein